MEGYLGDPEDQSGPGFQSVSGPIPTTPEELKRIIRREIIRINKDTFFYYFSPPKLTELSILVSFLNGSNLKILRILAYPVVWYA